MALRHMKPFSPHDAPEEILRRWAAYDEDEANRAYRVAADCYEADWRAAYQRTAETYARRAAATRARIAQMQGAA
jgi:hypothetical protein